MKGTLRKSNFYAVLLAVLLVISTIPVTAQNVFAGTTLNADSDGYLLITNEDEFVEHLMSAKAIYKEELSKNFRLTRDLNLEKYTALQSIGKTGPYDNKPLFKGNFDGNGHTIKNLKINEGGLFTNIDKSASIKNLTLDNAIISIKRLYFPGILLSKNEGTIENCRVINSSITSAQGGTGGLAGINNGKISKSAVINVTVSAENAMQVGGFVGFNGYSSGSGNIDQCFVDANVVGLANVGGFAGKCEKGTISNAYALGTVTATKNEKIGGFVGGHTSPSKLENIYVNNDVKADQGGAVVGWKGASYASIGTVINGYYNSEKMRPAKEMASFSGVIAKTTAEMASAKYLNEISGNTQGVWTQDVDHNNGFPYISAVIPPKTETIVPPKAPVTFVICNYDKEDNIFKKINEFIVKPEKNDSTIIDLMNRAREEKKFTFKTEASEWGEFVNTIDDITASKPDGWMFNVNDVPSPVGVSTAKFNGGEKVLWFYGCDQNHYTAPTLDEIENPKEKFVEINSKEELLKLSGSTDDEVLSKNYILNKDIDLAGIKFEPIGNLEHPFTGKFFGQKHNIKNLRIEKDKESRGIGLFGAIKGSEIKDLNIENAKIKGGSVIGVLVGEAQVDANAKKNNLIAHCKVSGTVESNGERFIKIADVGGLVGVSQEEYDNNTFAFASTTIYDVVADVNVVADTGAKDKSTSGHVGGLVGHNKGKIIDSIARGDVLGGNTTGGLVGYNDGSVRGSSARGNVTGVYNVGGFCGASGLYSETKDSYSTGNVKPVKGENAEYLGGFAGTISGKVENCVSTGTVTPGYSWNGGFAGKIDATLVGPNATVKEVYGNCNDFNDQTLKGYGNYLPNPEDTSLADVVKKMQVDKETAEKLANERFDAKIDSTKTKEKLENERFEALKEQIVIPSPILLDSEDILKSSRKIVDKLSEKQKKLLNDKIKELENAEKTFRNIKNNPTLSFLDSKVLNKDNKIKFINGYGEVSFEEGKANGLSLKVDSDYKYFHDGQELNKNAKVSLVIDGAEKILEYGKDYESNNGSIVIKFSKNWLNSFKAGDYTGKIQSNEGYAEYKIHVYGANSNEQISDNNSSVNNSEKMTNNTVIKEKLEKGLRNVKTGDAINYILFVLILVVAATMVIYVSDRKKAIK